MGGLDYLKLLEGEPLSNSEKRLFAVARGLLTGAPVFLLDEPTSDMDNATEERFNTGLKSWLQGRAGLVISHRVGTIAAADRVWFFQLGALVEEGKTETLLSNPRSNLAKITMQNEVPLKLEKSQEEDDSMKLEKPPEDASPDASPAKESRLRGAGAGYAVRGRQCGCSDTFLKVVPSYCGGTE